MPHPLPLESGTMLGDRFRVRQVLGRGGFGIAYECDDLGLRDVAVVKELAPDGIRRSGTYLELGEDASRLRSRFLDEAQTIQKLVHPGVLPMRGAFVENGTAYFATTYVAAARTLQALIDDEGQLPLDGALDLFYQLLETLEAVHRRGILHRDIKPSNILVDPRGHAYLIDFGAAREWHAGARQTQTVSFTPGYAPPEQLSEKARRGPATDIYGLCATFYHMLMGEAPPSATDRVAGIPLPSIRSHRADVDASLIHVIESGLQLPYGARPQSIEDIRVLIAPIDEPNSAAELTRLDELAVRLKAFRFEKRQCPACRKGALLEPRPLRKGVCPVCHQGNLQRHDVHLNLCSQCRSGTLQVLDNRGPLAICPACDVGRLATRKRSLLSKDRIATCQACQATFDLLEDGMSRDGAYRTFAEWRGHRSEEVWVCDSCPVQWDHLSDGRLLFVAPIRGAARYPEEWGKMALGLPPDAGDAECNLCGAEFDLDATSITLIEADTDPHLYAAHYLHRRVPMDAMPWLAVGKESPEPGWVCEECATEFSRSGDLWTLVRTNNARLGKGEGTSLPPEDWHRLALGIPGRGEEASFWQSIDDAILAAYLDGQIGFGPAGNQSWNGMAQRHSNGQKANLVVDEESVSFDTLLRKWRVLLADVASTGGVELEWFIDVEGVRQPFTLRPMDLTAHLKSGDRTIRLDATHLAERLHRRMTATRLPSQG